MELRTERLLLRAWRRADRDPFAAMNADPGVMEYFPSTLTPEATDGLIARIEAHWLEHRFGLWAVEVPGEVPFAGFVGLMVPKFVAHFTPCVEIGWRLAKSAWGRGYATEAAAAAVRWGFETLGLEEIVSLTTPKNVRSRRVMEKLGMTRDPNDDFDHPALGPGHPLNPHVLYRLKKGNSLLSTNAVHGRADGR